MKCVNEKCENEAILQFDHNGELVFYCDGCYMKFCLVMDAMGAFRPSAYEIGTQRRYEH